MKYITARFANADVRAIDVSCRNKECSDNVQTPHNYYDIIIPSTSPFVGTQKLRVHKKKIVDES